MATQECGALNSRRRSGRISRILFARARLAPRATGRSFIWTGRCRPARAPYPQPVLRFPRVGNSQAWTGRPRLLLGLAGGGVYPAATVTRRAVRSYRTISPLPPEGGGIFSVALSLGSRRVGVTNHRALPSSDFPHADQPMPASTHQPARDRHRPLRRRLRSYQIAIPLTNQRMAAECE
jgi:hypothetical protein